MGEESKERSAGRGLMGYLCEPVKKTKKTKNTDPAAAAAIRASHASEQQVI